MSNIPMSEESLIQAKMRFDRIKAIADSLTCIDRNGYTDELYPGSVRHLMETIDSLVEEGRAQLKY